MTDLIDRLFKRREMPQAPTLAEMPNALYMVSPLPRYPELFLDPSKKREILQRVLEWATKE
jgi:hypothetical protein